MSHDKRKTLYLHFHKTYNHQTCQCCDLGWGVPTYQATCSFDHVVIDVTWQYKNVISALLKTYKNKNWHCGDLAWGAPTYWVRCSFDHVLIRFHVKKWKCYFSTSYKFQIWHCGDLWFGPPTHKVICLFITRSHNATWQIRNGLSPLPQDIFKTNLAKLWLKMTS